MNANATNTAPANPNKTNKAFEILKELTLVNHDVFKRSGQRYAFIIKTADGWQKIGARNTISATVDQILLATLVTCCNKKGWLVALAQIKTNPNIWMASVIAPTKKATFGTYLPDERASNPSIALARSYIEAMKGNWDAEQD